MDGGDGETVYSTRGIKMFNELCWWLNHIHPAIAERLRRIVKALFWKHLKEWKYGASTAGYIGGIDLRYFGTLAFRDDDGELHYRW